MQTTKTERYFIFILLAIVFIVALLILYPFLTIFILAAAFAVVLKPIYSWVKKRVYKEKSWIASFLTIIIFLVGLCIPLFLIGTAVFNQTQDVYYSIVVDGGADRFIEKVDLSINKILPEGFSFDTRSKIIQLVESFANNLASFFTATFNTIIMFVIMIMALYYLLKDGEKWRKGIISLLPLSDKNAEDIINNIKGSINRVLKGSFIIAIVQGIMAWLGYTIFSVPNSAIWGLVAGIASFIPTFGTSLISVPAIIYLFISGMELQAIGLLLWSMIMIGGIDDLLSPYIISKGTDIPLLFILFSVLGGISLMGPIGILIGPLVLGLLYSLISIYKKELKIKIEEESNIQKNQN